MEQSGAGSTDDGPTVDVPSASSAAPQPVEMASAAVAVSTAARVAWDLFMVTPLSDSMTMRSPCREGVTEWSPTGYAESARASSCLAPSSLEAP